MRTPKFVPVLFHNLEGYDSHLFVKSLGGKVRCIPKTDEKYISFSKYIEINGNTRDDEEMRLIQAIRESNWTREEISEMVDWTDEEIDQVLNLTDEECEKPKLKSEALEIRFLDSTKFTLKSLDGLVKGLGPDQFKSLEKGMGGNKLLKKKGVFPYEFMSDFEKLNVNKLPTKSKFYSRLNDSNITDEEYKHAQNVWKEFNCKTMRDYHDLHLKTDVLLLADVMENYRNVCIDNYGLDPLWYYTAPGLAWDAALKISKIELELLTDPDMYLMVEGGIRGGISTIMKRYAKANNPYIGKIREKSPIGIMKELKKVTNEEHQFSVDAVCEYFLDFSAEEIKDLKAKMANGAIFNPEQVTKYIMYLEANNLYGWAMSQPLPVDEFK